MRLQDGVELGFLFERVGRKYNDKQTVATCFACLSRFVLDQITVFDYKLRFEVPSSSLLISRHPGMRGLTF